MKTFKEFLRESGFGKDLEENIIDEKLYHSATWEGLDQLLNNFDPYLELCCSTKSGSKKLFGRDLCIIFKRKKRKVLYDSVDADAGKYFGWDEVRVKFNSKNELKNEIENIIVPIGVKDYYEDTENEDEMWVFDMIERHNLYNKIKESNDKFYNF